MARQVRPGVLTPDIDKRHNAHAILREIARAARAFTRDDWHPHELHAEKQYLKMLLRRLDEIDAG